MEFGQYLVGLFGFVIGFPAHVDHRLALGNKGGISKGDLCHSFAVAVFAADRTKHLFGEHSQNLTLTGRKHGNVHLTGNGGGDNGMVVGNFLAVADLFALHRRWSRQTADGSRNTDNSAYTACHIVGEESAVGSGIGA